MTHRRHSLLHALILIKMVFIVLYMGTIVPNKEKTDAFSITRLQDYTLDFGCYTQNFFYTFPLLKIAHLCVFASTCFPMFSPYPFPLTYTDVFTSLVDFLDACKRLWRLCVVAGILDSKNPELYYWPLRGQLVHPVHYSLKMKI